MDWPGKVSQFAGYLRVHGISAQRTVPPVVVAGGAGMLSIAHFLSVEISGWQLLFSLVSVFPSIYLDTSIPGISLCEGL